MRVNRAMAPVRVILADESYAIAEVDAFRISR